MVNLNIGLLKVRYSYVFVIKIPIVCKVLCSVNVAKIECLTIFLPPWTMSIDSLFKVNMTSVRGLFFTLRQDIKFRT